MKKLFLWEEKPPLWPGGLGEDYPFLEMDEGADDRPFLLVCPGGGYQRLAPHEGHPVADFFRKEGFGTGVLFYRVAAEKAREPLGQGPLLDAQRALRLIRRELGEKKRIVMVGFSAGGHLSTCAGVHHQPLAGHPADGLARVDTRPDALVLCYPWISASTKVHQRSIDTLCGAMDEAGLFDFFTLEKKVSGETPPAFIMHTADDAVVPVENALYFSEALSRMKVPFALHVFPEGVHGIGLGENNKLAACWPTLASAWLKSLFPSLKL